jgi:hypothetical protein
MIQVSLTQWACYSGSYCIEGGPDDMPLIDFVNLREGTLLE